MGQVNRGTPFKLATINRARDGKRRLARYEGGLEQRTASAAGRSDDEPAGMPPPVPQSWPRVFPGL